MELSELKNFDYLILAILAASTYFGWKSGFIKSFISFFAWVGSAIIVKDSYTYVYEHIHKYIPSELICGFIASFVFYVALVIIILYYGERVSKATSKVGGGAIDQITGAVFGVARGALIALAIFWLCYISFFTLDNEKLPKWLSEAKSYKALKLGSDSVVSVIVSEEERKKILKNIMHKAKESEKEAKKSGSSAIDRIKEIGE